MTPRVSVRGEGATHVGNVREANEDSMIVDPSVGLYAVFDGMGGAMAGDVASQRARDVVKEYVRARRNHMEVRALLDAALNAASAAVHAEATARRDRRGMGTTAVVCVVTDERAVVAHVGDSRAYLLREGRLSQLTRDHTVVAELLAQQAIRPEEAEHHAYKSVLSRNLGGKAEARVDVCEVTLQRGDRILLCSDGLYGFASTEAVQHLLGSTDAPDQVARDLVEAALRGGGGDNVTVIVLDAGVATVPRTTQILRTSGSVSWWTRRERFMAAARDAGLAQNPLCAVLSPAEALQIVAGNFVEAVFHDLEKATTVNVWTFAENVAHGWLDRGGSWPPLRQLLDILHHACSQVVGELGRDDVNLGLTLEAAVTRELTVAEMAVGGVLGEQLRAVETELVRLHGEREAASAAAAQKAAAEAAPKAVAEAPKAAARPATPGPAQQVAAAAARHAASPPPHPTAPAKPFVDHPTIPFLEKNPPAEAPAPEVKAALEAAVQRVSGRERDPNVRVVLGRLHAAASDGGSAAAITVHARELFGVRALEEGAIAPLFDAIDRARIALAAAIRAGGAPALTQAGAQRLMATASHRLASALASLVVEAAVPVAEKLRDAMKETATLRAQVGKTEAKLAELERTFATVYDPLAGKIAMETHDAHQPPGRKR